MEEPYGNARAQAEVGIRRVLGNGEIGVARCEGRSPELPRERLHHDGRRGPRRRRAARLARGHTGSQARQASSLACIQPRSSSPSDGSRPVPVSRSAAS